MQRPLIITTSSSNKENYFVRREFITEIERAGGAPLIVAAGEAVSIQDIFPIMDGLYLTGGDDIHPSFYGEEIAPHYNGILDMPRDQLERELILYAIEHNVPIFGICRGMQALNVFLGGSLYQDINEEHEGALEHRPANTERGALTHPITIKEGSIIANIIGKEGFMVNSIHHQAVKGLGKDLVASAVSPDGIIEAIELPNHPFAIGVEWHPEELKDEPSKELFKRFIEATRQQMEK